MPRKTGERWVVWGTPRKPLAEKMGSAGTKEQSLIKKKMKESEHEGVRMASWNLCRGLFAKEQEITSVLSDHKLDILFLQETD